MTIVGSAAVADAPTRPAAPTANHRRRGLLFVTIATTMTIAWALSVISYVRPAGTGGELPDYSTIEPMRGLLWAFFVVAAVNLIVGVCAAAVAGWILTPARGARWATVGGGLIWLGAAMYGVGVGGWAAVYYFASDEVLDPAAGTALVERVNQDSLHVLLVPIAGAALVLVGSMLMSVGVWRARTVPWWIVLGGILSSLATFAVAPSTIAGVVAEGASSATTIAIGWYAWRRGPQ